MRRYPRHGPLEQLALLGTGLVLFALCLAVDVMAWLGRWWATSVEEALMEETE